MAPKRNKGKLWSILQKFQYIENIINLYIIIDAEFYGILEDLNYSVNVAEWNILLATDSLEIFYSTNAISKKIQKAIRNGIKLFPPCWVLSHIGIHGIESADKVTVQATTYPVNTQFQKTNDIKAYTKKTY